MKRCSKDNFTEVFFSTIMKFASKKRLGLTLLAFISTLLSYVLCLALILAANLIIRLIMSSVSVVTWFDQFFHRKYTGIRGSAGNRSSSVRYRNKDLRNLENDINDYFTGILLLWIPKNLISHCYLNFILHVHRNSFSIPESFHGIIYARLFYSNFNDESMDSVMECGTANHESPKKTSRFNFRSFFIYSFILRAHHSCTVLIRILLLTIRASLKYGLWITSQRQSFEIRHQLNDYEDADRKNLDCAKRINRSLISQGMKPNFLQILLVWSPTASVTPDTIVTFLSKFENNIQIREQWNEVPEEIDVPSALVGIMATFLSFGKMYTAAKALSVSFKNLKFISAKRLLSFIFHAEACHPECGFKTCEVIIRGKRRISKEEHKEKLKDVLSEFGIIKNINFTENFQSSGLDIVCTLEYTFVTYAYFAKLYVDRTKLPEPLKGKIFIEIKDSDYVKAITRNVKGKLIEHFEKNQIFDF